MKCFKNYSFRNTRNDYLRAGGHDANIITRYADLEYKYNAYQDYPWNKDYPEPLKRMKCLCCI